MVLTPWRLRSFTPITTWTRCWRAAWAMRRISGPGSSMALRRFSNQGLASTGFITQLQYG